MKIPDSLAQAWVAASRGWTGTGALLSLRRAPGNPSWNNMQPLRRLLREPLVHFVLLGGAVFCAWLVFKSDDYSSTDEATIVVDRRSLLTFMQYRASAFDPDVFAAALDEMSQDELDHLIAAYVDDVIILSRPSHQLGIKCTAVTDRGPMGRRNALGL